MKKLLYSLALVMMGFASCTDWDDAVTENYGAGPSISIDIQAGTPSDSAFTVTLTPAAGSTYYAFILDENDVAEELNNYTLLKGGYGNTVLNTSNYATYTFTITTASPNTTYQVYAVSSNDKGIAGEVTVASITTTDVLEPTPATIKRDGDNRAVQIGFSENISRGTGSVTAKYYKEWDIMNPVEIPETEIAVSVKGNVVTFAAPETPAGAYVCFSWGEGAFVDGKGNPTNSFESGLNMNTGKFIGAWVHATNVPFEIDNAFVTTPENGSLFGDWKEFKGEITFPETVYRNNQTVALGDLYVTYTNTNKTANYKLAATDWDVDGNVLTFQLPAPTEAGDVVTVSLVEGAVSDVLGNPNAAFTSKTSWKCFAPTIDMVLGAFEMNYISYFDDTKTMQSLGIISIEANPEQENGVIVNNLFLDGSQLAGSFDQVNGKLCIADGQIVGPYTNSKGVTYGLVFYNASDDGDVTFTINSDGTMTADGMWGIFAFDETYSEQIGWFDVAAATEFVPQTVSAARQAISSVKNVQPKKTVSLSKKLRQNLKKRVSK